MNYWTYDDGGRVAAGFRGDTGDCVTRAVAIAAGMDYREVYELVNRLSAGERLRRSSNNANPKRSSARTGVSNRTTRKLMEHLGWSWTPTMSIGSGCTVHLSPEELPAGRLVAKCSRHVCAVINGIVRDTHDPTREGTRCVYGYWTPPA